MSTSSLVLTSRTLSSMRRTMSLHSATSAILYQRPTSALAMAESREYTRMVSAAMMTIGVDQRSEISARLKKRIRSHLTTWT